MTATRRWSGVFTMKFTTHTQVMIIGLIVLIFAFLLSLYYSLSAEHAYELDRFRNKEAYLSRVVSLYLDRSVRNGNMAQLKLALTALLTGDDDISYLRLIAGKTDLEVQSPGFRTDFADRVRTVVYNEKDRPTGELYACFSKSTRVEPTTKQTLLNVVIVSDILVLFGLALHLLLREIVTRPLESFVEATKRIAQGDFDSYLEGPIVSTEQERLALSFNHMIDRLRDSRGRLQHINEELEERVQRRTEQLQQEKSRSEGILASVADGVYTISEDWELLTFNPAAEKMTGRKAQEVRGQKCWEVLKYPFCKSNCLLKRLPRDSRDATREIYVEEFQKMGTSFIVSGAPLYDSAGHRVGGVESMKDITYVKQLHDQIRQADKLSSIGILAAGVAHEINNPLSNIRLYSQIMAEEVQQSSSMVQSSLANIVQETDRATKIVRNLLEFSRLGMPAFERTQLRSVIDTAIGILEHQLALDRVRISVQVPDNLPAIWADRGNLQQVFINIMTNARDAMRPRGGSLRIRAWHDQIAHRLLVGFADTGPGIPGESIQRIFDPFFTTKEVGTGTGLGLSISYGIVKDHGGDIQVKSKPGEGAEFLISLPAEL